MTETVKIIIEHILSMTNSYFMAAAVTVFLQCFYDNGIRWSRKKAGVLGIYVLAEALLTASFPENGMIGGVLFFLYVIIPVYDCKGKRLRRALRVLLSYMIIMWTVASAAVFGFIYLMPGFDHEAESYSMTEELAINLLCITFFGFVFYYLKNRLVKRDIFIRCGKRENLTVAVYAVFVFFMLVMAILSEEETQAAHIVMTVFAAVCFVFMIAFPMYLFHSRLSGHYRRANERHESYMQSQLEHFRQYKAAQEETARFRHDIRNNLQCISDLLSSGKEREAEEYIAELLDEVRSLSPEYVSGDEILDCIISSKASVMKREGIAMSLDGVIPGGLGWMAIDVCNVFANALDNAIESCVKVPADKRYISMSLKSSEQFRYIRIENAAAEDVDTDKLFCERGGFTSKKHTSEHGMGTYSIKRTAEKYGGVVKAECENSVFTLELIINKSSSF